MFILRYYYFRLFSTTMETKFIMEFIMYRNIVRVDGRSGAGPSDGRVAVTFNP